MSHFSVVITSINYKNGDIPGQYLYKDCKHEHVVFALKGGINPSQNCIAFIRFPFPSFCPEVRTVPKSLYCNEQWT